VVYWYCKEEIMRKFWIFALIAALIGLVVTIIRGRS
jgi:hypothetical protein